MAYIESPLDRIVDVHFGAPPGGGYAEMHFEWTFAAGFNDTVPMPGHPTRVDPPLSASGGGISIPAGGHWIGALVFYIQAPAGYTEAQGILKLNGGTIASTPVASGFNPGARLITAGVNYSYSGGGLLTVDMYCRTIDGAQVLSTSQFWISWSSGPAQDAL